MTTRIDAPAAAPPARLPAIDAARGAAVLTMFVYHFAWDLSFYRLIALDVPASPGWGLFARAIAASFLALAGASLTLAHRGGIRPRPFLRRLAVIAGAAAAITIATWFAFPDSFIYFGILHCIAVSSVLGLAFLRLPTWLVLAAAAACLAAPSFLAAPAFDAPAWRWLGLMTYFPRTNDYVPLLPWFGFVLLGLAAARPMIARAPGAAWAEWRPRGKVGRGIVWAGRRSLPLYLLHQPVFLGLLYVVAAIGGAGATAERTDFLATCEARCAETGSGVAVCAAYCGCVADALQVEGLWRDVLDDQLDADGRDRLAGITRQCRPGG